jgi:hypothetical protein
MPGSHLKFVRTLDFGVLNGLAARAAAEIRETEDALIAFIEAEQKRDALHAKTKQEIAAKYNQQDRLGGAADRRADGLSRLPDPAAAAAHSAAVRRAVHEGRRSRCRCNAAHRRPGVLRRSGGRCRLRRRAGVSD